MEEAKKEQELTGDGLGDVEPTPVEEATIDRTQDEIAELNARLARAHADYENFRRRSTKEREEFATYANQRLILSLLPVLDNLERALSTPTTDGDEKLRQGLEMTARSFREALAKEGATPIVAVGQPFDPKLHEAVMTVESDEHEDGTVILEFQKGFRLGERVVRPSMVQVSKKG
jgi:molecular chaperone GrpE